jgi:transposase-like protein
MSKSKLYKRYRIRTRKNLNFSKFLQNSGCRKFKHVSFQRHPHLNLNNLINSWFAGFFLGDGSIDSKTQKGRLNLAKKDIHLLRFICKHFGFSRERVKKYKKHCRLNFSKRFTMRLKQLYRISTKKSYGKVRFPDFLSQRQMKFFLLGLLYSDGNIRIYKHLNSTQYAVRFLQSKKFCERLLIWIQQNTTYFSHYNKTNISTIPTKTPNYDLACLELAGIDSVKFVRWLLKSNYIYIPKLQRKFGVLLKVDVAKVKQITKIPVTQRFTSRAKRPWTQNEIQQLKNYISANPTHTDEIIGKVLNRTPRAVAHQRNKLGIQKNLLGVAKSKNHPYSKEEIKCIEETLKQTTDRNDQILIDLVNRLNDLPCNKGTIQRTLKGVRTFIKKHIDK